MPDDRVTFVARDAQLQGLEEALRQALDGKTTVCFVTGEAGAGKTALVREFGRRAELEHQSLVQASGNCSAFSGDADPYLPFREILAQLTGSADAKVAEGALTSESAGRLAGILRKTSGALIEYGPALIEIFVPGAELAAKLGKKVVRRSGQRRQDGYGERGSTAGDGGVVDQGQIFEQYTNVLRRVASDSPLLLVLDDLHWVDPASVGLLFHLVRRLGDAPVLFVGTYRPQDVALGRDGERHPMEQVVAELRRLVGEVVIDLDAASDSEDREMIDALIDVEPNRLGENFRRALQERTDGQPLFTTELLQTMRERGDLVRDDQGRWIETGAFDWDVLPARVEGVIGERMGRLRSAERRLLLVGSVEGEEFTAEVVAAVEEQAPRDVVRALSSDAVKSHDVLRARGVLRTGEQRLTRYGFRHKSRLTNRREPGFTKTWPAHSRSSTVSVPRTWHSSWHGTMRRPDFCVNPSISSCWQQVLREARRRTKRRRRASRKRWRSWSAWRARRTLAWTVPGCWRSANRRWRPWVTFSRTPEGTTRLERSTRRRSRS